MPNKFFISDTHFFHDRIIGLGARPFDNIYEMHDTIVERWNANVKDEDTVYHLGDVAFQLHDREFDIHVLLSRLRGEKILLMGNHDRLPSVIRWYFKEVHMWKKFGRSNFVASHVPIDMGELDTRDLKFNVHGHVHQSSRKDKRYINVCVEATNYRPVSLDEIRANIKCATETDGEYKHWWATDV